MTSSKRIVTHSGSFHVDEALAIYMLRLLPEYDEAEIIRTRDPAVIDAADIVVDVGGTYEPEKNRFDHHQRGFEERFSPRHTVTKLSSAGLIYKHFGKRSISQLLAKEANPQFKQGAAALTTEEVDIIYLKVYDNFIEGIDGIDNGVTRYPGQEGLYKESTNLGQRVSRLNPWWNEEGVSEDERFTQAMEIAGQEFVSVVRDLALSWLPARDIVQAALKSRKILHESGKIIALSQFCPWKVHLFILENELKLEDSDLPLYMLYSDQSGKWRVQAVPISADSFESRKPLPEPWRGLRDDELSRLTGIPGCIFCHATGFIGGNKTKEGALAMAMKSLEL